MSLKSESVINGENPSGNRPTFRSNLFVRFPGIQPKTGIHFFDNAAGAQVPQVVLDAVNHHLIECNAQRGGRYAKSRAVDEMSSAPGKAWQTW